MLLRVEEINNRLQVGQYLLAVFSFVTNPKFVLFGNAHYQWKGDVMKCSSLQKGGERVKSLSLPVI